MHRYRYLLSSCVLMTGLAIVGMTSRAIANNPRVDFGAFVADQLRAHSEELFGFRRPLDRSALGPYDGADNVQAIQVADGLRVSLVSSGVASAADQIAFWPNDDRPTHVFVCDEETSIPAVQRVDLSGPADANVTTIVTGLTSCDPVRRTPWGTIIVAEEAGATGGLYEIINPLSINTVINVSDRDAGTTSDARLVKRKAVGSLSFEGLAIEDDGTMIYADELAPSGGNAGGAVYKFVPAIPYTGNGPITVAAASPLESGTIYGLRVAGAGGSTNWGQGAETGKGVWIAVNLAGLNVVDAKNNVILRTAQLLQKFTGYYRPEDMDIDPTAARRGVFRACWANTGRFSHTDGSVVENSAVQNEILCLVEEPPSTAVPNPPTGTIPTVERFLTGSEERAMYDNVAFQPHTGNLVILEDGSVDVVKRDGTTQKRGNDLWMCLPDGRDDDTLSDGCVRFASVRDTTAEPSGFIFFGSGREALVHIQHRGFNDAQGNTNHGALLKISGFRVRSGFGSRDDDFDDDGRVDGDGSDWR